MRLKYKILWFEDDSEFLEKRLVPRIEKYLSEGLGFDSEIVHKTSGTNVDALVSREEYDLIVTDLNLTQGKDEIGQKIIEKVRLQKILTDVLLYSSSPRAIKEIKEKNPGIERISFASGRAAIYDKLCEIIFLTVRKVQDVNNLRGMVITEAIDIETRIRDLLVEKFEELDADELEKLRQKKIKHKKNNVDKLKKSVAKSVSQLVEGLFTFSELHDELMGMIGEAISETKRVLCDPRKAKSTDPKLIKLKKLAFLRDELQKMKSDVIHLRNDMAHAKAERHPTTGRPVLTSIISGKKQHFDDTKCIKIRKAILSHFQNIEEIAKHL
ncbi:MAG: hypothetical protein WCT49_00865 [Candidatus Paceibacterota bacterium]|jgi:hypothetical protein|nr:hypothetical protein [Candidatus Paceibacterota bacterium]